jgi:hypothetical protein
MRSRSLLVAPIRPCRRYTYTRLRFCFSVRKRLLPDVSRVAERNWQRGRTHKQNKLSKRIAPGTPHRGSDAAVAMTTVLRSIASIAVNENLAGLDKRSMQISNESWIHLSHMYRVASFYETIPSNIATKRVVRAFLYLSLDVYL